MRETVYRCDRCKRQTRTFTVGSEDVCGDCLTDTDAMNLALDEITANYGSSSEAADALRIRLGLTEADR